MAQTAAGRWENGAETGARPPASSELRLRVGGVEIIVSGDSREDCLRQLEAAAQEVDEETRQAEARWRLTAAGRREAAGPGQRAAAAQLCVSRSYLAEIERGRRDGPNARALAAGLALLSTPVAAKPR